MIGAARAWAAGGRDAVAGPPSMSSAMHSASRRQRDGRQIDETLRNSIAGPLTLRVPLWRCAANAARSEHRHRMGDLTAALGACQAAYRLPSACRNGRRRGWDATGDLQAW